MEEEEEEEGSSKLYKIGRASLTAASTLREDILISFSFVGIQTGSLKTERHFIYLRISPSPCF